MWLWELITGKWCTRFLFEHIDSVYIHLLTSFPPFPRILSLNNLLLTCPLLLLFFHAGENFWPGFPWRSMICEKHNKNGKTGETSAAGREGLEGQRSELPCCDSLWWGINRMSGQGKSSACCSELIPSEDFSIPVSQCKGGSDDRGLQAWPVDTESPLKMMLYL